MTEDAVLKVPDHCALTIFVLLRIYMRNRTVVLRNRTVVLRKPHGRISEIHTVILRNPHGHIAKSARSHCGIRTVILRNTHGRFPNTLEPF